MSKDNLAFRKYGIRPSADWERWHDAKDSFPNGSVPHLNSAPAVAQEAVDIAKKNANLATRVANISHSIAKNTSDEGLAQVAASHARDANREKDEAVNMAARAEEVAAAGDPSGAANAALNALDHAQNAAQYAQLAANAAANAGTPKLVVEDAMRKAQDSHDRAEESKTGILAALRRYLARVRAAL